MAVHSLSKRSNLAGVRAGFFAGDPELVGFLADVRRHAGLMVPGPVQAGAVAAFDDDRHVVEQRERYQERLGFLRRQLEDVGLPTPMPEGGFYLWVPVPGSVGGSGWELAEVLALDGGLLVSPGDLYGPDGAGFVRVAVVQPMERLALAAERLSRHPVADRVVGTAPGTRRRTAVPIPRAIVWPMSDAPVQDRRAVGARPELDASDGDTLTVVSEAIDLLDQGTARVAEVDAGHRRGGRPPVAEAGHPPALPPAARWRPRRWVRSSSPTSSP